MSITAQADRARSELPKAAPVIEVQNLAVNLAGTEILKGVSLEVRPAEAVALMGANGSGKSTLVKAVLGIHHLVSGTASLFGETKTKNIPWPKIGYVPQRIATNNSIPASVLEVVSTGLLNREQRWLPRNAKAQALAALAEVELADRAHSPLHLLSGGQQQRAMIARAMVRNPELLILDEPLAGIDFHSQELFAQTLKKFQASGNTVLMVLHELGDFSELITRTVVLKDGQISYDGTPITSFQELARYTHPHPELHQSEIGERK